MKIPIYKTCKKCKCIFDANRHHSEVSYFCSRKCFYAYSKGKNHIGYKNGRIISHGYTYLYKPDYYCSDKKGYVKQAKCLMEKNLKRRLKKDEIVHHIDGNTQNDNIKNLKVMSKKAHGKYHAKVQGLGTKIRPPKNQIKMTKYRKLYGKTSFELAVINKVCPETISRWFKLGVLSKSGERKRCTKLPRKE